MRKFGIALKLAALGFGATLATAATAEGLAFEPIDPEGLDPAALEVVEKAQASMPGQMAFFAQGGFLAYGAVAVPQGTELDPANVADWLVMRQALETADAAKAAVLEGCEAQTGTACTLIGVILPES